MQIKSTQINKERLNGNKLYLHTFKSFSTTSAKFSLKTHIIHALISILTLLVILYIIFVVLIISNIINKKEGLATINDFNFKTAKTEREYNNTISSINKEYALNNGFVEVNSKNFASRKDAAASLSFLYESKVN